MANLVFASTVKTQPENRCRYIGSPKCRWFTDLPEQSTIKTTRSLARIRGAYILVLAMIRLSTRYENEDKVGNARASPVVMIPAWVES